MVALPNSHTPNSSNQSLDQNQPSFAKNLKNTIHLEMTSQVSSTDVNLQQLHPRMANIYSTILAGMQNNLTVRKTQSESATNVLTTLPTPAVVSKPKEELTDIFEVESIKEICDLPGLEVVKRLSVFEEICPSDLDREDEGMMQLSNVAGDSAVGGL